MKQNCISNFPHYPSKDYEEDELLLAIAWANRMKFAEILTYQLERVEADYRDLHKYLEMRDFPIGFYHMKRYFSQTPSVSRIPSEDFLERFAEFVRLTSDEKEGLFIIWQSKRKRPRRAKLV